jgi:EmrB/QacA subfamily drug resistance transporter
MNETVKVDRGAMSGVTWRTVVTLVGVALGIFMGALESTVVGTAMPTVIASLGGIEIYSWVFAAYILATTIMTPIWGKMTDLIGRRPAFFGGLACFIIGSALSGAARSMPQLIAFRALQGLGAGALFPVGMTIVADLLTLERRAKVIGLFSGMWGVASLFGPLAGGYLTDHLSWRWVFYINLPVGLLTAGMIWATYTERHGRRKNISLDYAGAITLSGCLILLLLVVETGVNQSPLVTLACGLGALALLAAFISIERRSPEPLVPLDLFHNRLVTTATLHGFFASIALLGTMAFLPLFVQAVIGTSATKAGSILTPFILSWTFFAVIGGRLLLRLGYRPVAIAGMTLMLVGAGLLARVSTATTQMQLAIHVIFLGIGGGLTFATLTLAVQHAVTRARLGVATSTLQFARSIGATIGIGAMGALMSWQVRRALAAGSSELAGLASGSYDISAIVLQSTRAELSPAATAFLRQTLAGSLRQAFTLVLVGALAAAVVSFFIPGGSARDLMHPEHHD